MSAVGAFPDKRSVEMSDEAMGFIVKGPIAASALYKKLAKFRVNLAPLRFGAVSLLLM